MICLRNLFSFYLALVLIYGEMSFFVSSEVVSFEVVVMKTLPPLSTALKANRYESQKSVHFIAFGKDFILDLERFFPLHDSEVIFRKGTEVINTTLLAASNAIYRGKDRLSKDDFEVFGWFDQYNRFIGYIFSDDTYFVEPSGFDEAAQVLVKVYRLQDAVYPGCINIGFDVICDHGFKKSEQLKGKWLLRDKRLAPKSFIDESDDNTNTTINPNGEHMLKKSEKVLTTKDVHNAQNDSSDSAQLSRILGEGGNSTDNTTDLPIIPTSSIRRCGLKVEVDYTYLDRFSLDAATALGNVFLTLHFVDTYFRQVEIEKGKDPIGISVQQIIVYLDKDRSIFSKPKPPDDDLDEYLSMVSRLRTYSVTQQFCLSVIFAHEDVLQGSLGYKLGDSEICSSRSNTVFITTYLNSLTSRLPMATEYFSAVVHIAEAFGVQIGEVDATNCSGTSLFKSLRRSPYPHILFTDCRTANVATRISKAGNCLKTEKVDHCGNGIRDRGERCDCGPKGICDLIDPCCSTECELRRNSSCSHGDPCCDKDCQIVEDDHSLPCGDEERICNPSTCNGKDAECPEPPEELQAKPCLQSFDTLDAITCDLGSCRNLICRDTLTLTPCRCESLFECTRCCQVPQGKCKPSGLIFNSSLYTREGSNCSNGICFKDGKCVNKKLLASSNRGSLLMPDSKISLFVIVVRMANYFVFITNKF